MIGSITQFKIWRDHDDALAAICELRQDLEPEAAKALDRAGGYYVFVAHYLRSEGIAVVDSRSVRASSLSTDWYGDVDRLVR